MQKDYQKNLNRIASITQSQNFNENTLAEGFQQYLKYQSTLVSLCNRKALIPFLQQLRASI
jgi:hypothetical protein